MYKFMLLIFMISASCGSQKNSDANSSNVELNSENNTVQEGGVVIDLEESVQIGEMVIQFKEVLEDSRCPIGVECVWEGRVRAMVAVSGDGMTTSEKEIIFGKTRPGEPTSKVIGSTQNVTVTATSISPERTADMDAANTAYKMLVTVSKM